jgi:hypothetical protein
LGGGDFAIFWRRQSEQILIGVTGRCCAEFCAAMDSMAHHGRQVYKRRR